MHKTLIALALFAGAAAHAQDKVTFATNWKAQAAHGGFYQAVADGTYKKYGLDVTIQQGGPSVNNRPLLPAGRIDFLMTGNLLHSFDNVKNKVPTVVVAAISPYREARAQARALVEEHGTFVEVWVNAPAAECAERDVKGLYAKAAAGEITGMTGVDDPYEPPQAAEVVLDTVALEPRESCALVVAYLERIGAVPAAGAVS